MCFLLAVFCSAVVTDRKYIENNKRYSGTWEYGESATIEDPENGKLILTSNEKKVKGLAWFSQRLPSEKWSVDVEFTMEKESSSSGLGIWFTKDYGAIGNCFGGPQSFKGVAVLCYYNGTEMMMEFRENDGHGQFTSYAFFPTLMISPKSPTVIVSLKYASKFLNITVKCDGNESVLFSDKPRVMVRRTWLAITGQNTNPGFEITLDSVNVQGPKKLPEFKKVEKQENTVLPLLHSVVEKRDINAVDIIGCLDELISYAEPLANASYTTKYVRDNMLPFTEKWQRRSLAVMTEMNSLKEKLIKDLNETELVFEILKNEVDTAFAKMREGIHDIESELYFGVLKGYDLDHKIRQAKKAIKKGGIIKILIGISIAETLVAIGFVIVHLVKKD